MFKSWLVGALAILGLAAGQSQPVAAQDGAEFFKGKTVRLVTGYATGGGYDNYARLLSKHFGKHLPGHPDVIVVNMPGAGTLKAVQSLETAPKDGTHLTMFNPGLIMSSLTTPDLVKVRFTDYTWIGTMSRDIRACYMWIGAGGKPGTLDDMRKRDQFIFGETGAGTQAYTEQRIVGEIFGVKVRQVRGYPGSGEKRLAIERGELDGDCGTWSSIPPDWISDNKISVVLRFGRYLGPGMSDKVPVAVDMVSDPKQKTLLNLLNAPTDFGRPFIVPKGTPADRVKILRQAFAKTLADPEFLADAEKQRLTIIAPMEGDEAEKQLVEIYQSPADVVAEAKVMSGE